ncbi:hypothetical protein R0J87_23950, partial [Halomonas sp. SIMBA_159]
VVSITVYRWGPPPDPQVVRRSVVQAGAGEVDAVLFTSAPGAAEWGGRDRPDGGQQQAPGRGSAPDRLQSPGTDGRPDPLG